VPSTRKFVTRDDLADLIRAHVGSDRRVVDIERFTGGSKKGVYRLTLDDGATIALYVWHPDENFWPVAPPSDPEDPFIDAIGIDLFEAAYQRLVAIGVGTPVVHVIDRSHTVYPADLALVEDVRGGTLEDLMERDRAAADRPIAMLREALTAMRHDGSTSFGTVAAVQAGNGVNDRPAPTVILRRALRHLAEAAGYEPRLDAAGHAIEAKLRDLAGAVRPRSGYGLIHGELGADHVMLDATGAPLLIDIEGLAYFDIEWEYVFLKIRFHEHYAALAVDDLDPDRMRFYQLAHHLSLVAGPLRIATVGDFHDVAFMREIADAHTERVLAHVV
jgi:phosphotransferase family enzyme